MLMPGYVRRFTVVYYLQGLVPHTIPSEGIASLLAYAFSDSPTCGNLPVFAGNCYRSWGSLVLAARAHRAPGVCPQPGDPFGRSGSGPGGTSSHTPYNPGRG